MKSFKFIFIFFFTVSLFHYFSFSQWVLQPSGTTNVMLDIDYVTPQNGGLVLACAIDGKIYRSSNSGANWVVISTGISTSLSDIEFTDALTGYSAGSQGVIIKTTNGGLNWSMLNTDTVNSYTCITFVNSATGFISGSGMSSAVILKTTNSGTNWTPSPLTTQANSLQSVFFIDASTGWAVGYNLTSFFSSILKTTNSGASWQEVFVSAAPDLYFDIFMISPSTGFSSGSTNIFKTTNGGSNITSVFTTANSQVDLEFINSLTGYSVGGPTLIYKTTNGGINWLQQTGQGSGVPLRTVSMIGDTGFICGANGTILKTTNGGQIPTGVQTLPGEIPGTFSLSQNYPNPFNPSTKINFNIPLSGRGSEGRGVFTQLTVYDILGNETAVLVNENLSAGTYSVDFNASSLPSGIYFYRLKAGGFTGTKKLTLIK